MPPKWLIRSAKKDENNNKAEKNLSLQNKNEGSKVVQRKELFREKKSTQIRNNILDFDLNAVLKHKQSDKNYNDDEFFSAFIRVQVQEKIIINCCCSHACWAYFFTEARFKC